MRDDLRAVFESKTWAKPHGKHPRSGSGSTLEATAPLRAALPGIFQRYEVKTFVDAPCGDWFWMQTVDLTGIDYLGGDISSELVAANQAKYARENIRFQHMDITSDPLPKADVFMCRDCLFHLKFGLRWSFFENFVASGSRYLLLTMHHVPLNRGLPENGMFRRFNPRVAPFNLAEPLEEVRETPDGAPEDERRSVGLWSREQVAKAVKNRAI